MKKVLPACLKVNKNLRTSNSSFKKAIKIFVSLQHDNVLVGQDRIKKSELRIKLEI